MSSRILTGDVFDMLPTIAAGSVDCVVTSPPYWMLRSYLPKDHPLKPRELGSEKTPGEFVARMVEVFRLVRDTMADHATCWLNMGDSYANSPSNGQALKASLTGNGGAGGCPSTGRTKREPGIDSGNLCLIPQRLAIALQDDGWLVRSVVVWHKPAPMPASVAGWRWMRCRVKVRSKKPATQPSKMNHNGGTACHRNAKGGVWIDGTDWSDCPGCAKCRPNGGLVLRRGSWRPTSSWEPILMLAKKPGYFADGEGVKTATKSSSLARVAQNNGNPIWNGNRERDSTQGKQTMNIKEMVDPAGANLRDVWTTKEPLFRLRADLSPEQRAYVLQRLIEHQRGS